MSAPGARRLNPDGTWSYDNTVSEQPRCRLPPQEPVTKVEVITKAEAERQKNAQLGQKPPAAASRGLEPGVQPQRMQELRCRLPPQEPVTKVEVITKAEAERQKNAQLGQKPPAAASRGLEPGVQPQRMQELRCQLPPQEPVTKVEVITKAEAERQRKAQFTEAALSSEEIAPRRRVGK